MQNRLHRSSHDGHGSHIRAITRCSGNSLCCDTHAMGSNISTNPNFSTCALSWPRPPTHPQSAFMLVTPRLIAVQSSAHCSKPKFPAYASSHMNAWEAEMPECGGGCWPGMLPGELLGMGPGAPAECVAAADTGTACASTRHASCRTHTPVRHCLTKNCQHVTFHTHARSLCHARGAHTWNSSAGGYASRICAACTGGHTLVHA